MDIEEGEDFKFTRCIICSLYSIKSQCFNIFETSLEKGKVMLSDFVKNVLGCSVLIVIPPDFFICKRCFALCNDLDNSLAKCNELQEEIQNLFKEAEERERLKKKLEQDSVEISASTGVQFDFENGLVEGEEICEAVIENEETDEIKSLTDLNVVEVEETGVNNGQLKADEKSHVESTDQLSNDQDKLLQDGAWRCESCFLPFGSEQLLSDHKESNECIPKSRKLGIKSTYELQDFSVKLRRKKKVFVCNRCTYETTHGANMRKHVKTHTTDASYMCDVCGRRFKYLKTFKQHQETHDESRPFICSLCPFRAKTEQSIKIHEKLHDEQKKYVCGFCGYKTLKKMSFIIHSRKHTGERPYCCPNCPYRAKDSSTLLRHRRIHGGIKRYYCTQCDFRSTQKGGLTIHMMTHTGEKPFACPLCDYRSTVKHNLDSHIAAIHSNEKPFACEQCSYKTKFKRLLTNHMRRHSDEKPYACTKCGYRVRYRGALSYHMKTKHPPDDEGNTYYIMSVCEEKRLNIDGEEYMFSDEDGISGSENEG